MVQLAGSETVILGVLDFPLQVVGAQVYARTLATPVFVASSPEIARQIAAAVNTAAEDQRPLDIGKAWLVIH